VNTHCDSNQADLIKHILINDIQLSSVFMILISFMKKED